MGFIQDIIRRFLGDGKSQAEAAKGNYRAVDRVGVGDYGILNNEILFAAVSRLANSMACIPFELKKDNRVVDVDDRYYHIHQLISQSPNPNLCRFDFLRTIEANMDTCGNAYALIVPDTQFYQPSRLDVLDPSRVGVVVNIDDNEIWYRVTYPGGSFLVHNKSMMHFKFPNSNGIVGLNPMRVLYSTLEYKSEIERLSIDNLKNGVESAVVLEAPTSLGDAQRAKAVAAFQKVYRDSKGNIMLLESGITAKELKLNPIEAKILDSEKISRSSVAMVYNIPPSLLGDFSDSGLRTAEQQMLSFLQLTILPRVVQYEDIFDRGLLTEEMIRQGYAIKGDINVLLRADTATRAGANFKLIRSAGKTPNEVRAEEGQPPKPGGDELYVSKDMIPLSMLKTLNLSEGGDKGEA